MRFVADHVITRIDMAGMLRWAWGAEHVYFRDQFNWGLTDDALDIALAVLAISLMGCTSTWRKAEMAKIQRASAPYAMNYEEYEGVANIIDHVRFMRSYFNEVVDEDPKTRQFLPELHCAYMDRLNVLFARHAFDLAAALVAWEDRTASLTDTLRRLRSVGKRTRVNAAAPGGRRKAKH